MLQVRDIRFHCANPLVVLRISAPLDGAGWFICRKRKTPASRKTSL